MKLILPFPPSMNSYWRSNRGRVMLSDKARKYKHEVWVAVLKQHKKISPIENRIIMTTTLYPPTKAVRDIDNYLKALCDSLERAGVYKNDSQIDKHIIIRGQVVKGGAAHVELKEFEGGMFDVEHLEKLKESGL